MEQKNMVEGIEYVKRDKPLVEIGPDFKDPIEVRLLAPLGTLAGKVHLEIRNHLKRFREFLAEIVVL